MLSHVYSRGDRVLVKCGDDEIRQGTVTGHFRQQGTQMYVVIPAELGWDGWFSEQALRGIVDSE